MSEFLVLVANSGDGTISSFTLDADGEMSRVAVSQGLPGCSTFAIDAERNLVYAAVKGDLPGIATCTLDRDSGELSVRSKLGLTQGGMNYLALSRRGGALLGASYGGGYGISVPVGERGVLGQPSSTIRFPNLHSVAASADGRFAYFVSLGDDLIAQYAVTDDLELLPLDSPTVAAPAGSGPRHLVLNLAQDAVYVLTEFSGEVLHYARDRETGSLTLVGQATAYDPSKGLGHSVFGADPMEHHYIWGADLHFGADERFLWCSERCENTLGAVGIGSDGSPTQPSVFTVTEKQPRGFALSPDGRFLVAAGEKSTTVTLYAVDDDQLTELGRLDTGAGANWVRVIER